MLTLLLKQIRALFGEFLNKPFFVSFSAFALCAIFGGTSFAEPLFHVGQNYKMTSVSSTPATELRLNDIVENVLVTGKKRRGTVIEPGSKFVKVHFDEPESSDVVYDLYKDKLYLVTSTEVQITEPTLDQINDLVRKKAQRGDPGKLEIVQPSQQYMLVSGGDFGKSYQVEGWLVKAASGESFVVFRNDQARWDVESPPPPDDGVIFHARSLMMHRRLEPFHDFSKSSEPLIKKTTPSKKAP